MSSIACRYPSCEDSSPPSAGKADAGGGSMSRMWVKILATLLVGSTLVLGATTNPSPSTQKSIVVQDLIREGEMALQGGDPKAARDAFDDATRADPANLRATTGLPRPYWKLGLGNGA